MSRDAGREASGGGRVVGRRWRVHPRGRARQTEHLRQQQPHALQLTLLARDEQRRGACASGGGQHPSAARLRDSRRGPEGRGASSEGWRPSGDGTRRCGGAAGARGSAPLRCGRLTSVVECCRSSCTHSSRPARGNKGWAGSRARTRQSDGAEGMEVCEHTVLARRVEGRLAALPREVDVDALARRARSGVSHSGRGKEERRSREAGYGVLVARGRVT